jgi:RNA polymerase-interacting CarD/CdnL/TRCF family regulator
MAEEKKEHQFKKGDMLVSPKGIFEIIDLKEKENIEGDKQEYYVLEPRYGRRKGSLKVSFPIKNIEKVRMRKVLTEKEMDQLLERFAEKMDHERMANTMKLRKMASSNEPKQLIDVIKTVYIYKHYMEKTSTSKNKVFKRALRQVAQEYACIKDVTVRTAKKRIKKQLKEGVKEAEGEQKTEE